MSYPVKDTDPTIGKLVSDASRDLSTLVSQEIALAKSELRVSIKNGGTGVGLFAGAAFFGVMSLIMLSVAIAYLIHWNGQGLDLHWAFLIVFGFYLLLAAILALIGVRKVKKVKGPERAIHQAQETAASLKRSDPSTGAL
jgi:hypothetical protein